MKQKATLSQSKVNIYSCNFTKTRYHFT